VDIPYRRDYGYIDTRAGRVFFHKSGMDANEMPEVHPPPQVNYLPLFQE